MPTRLPPVVIPIVAAAGLSSSVVAVIFQGAGATGLFLAPFTPPMVTLRGLTGITYPRALLGTGIPVSIVMWIVTNIYCKKILPTSIKEHPYSEEAVAVLNKDAEPRSQKEESIATQATAAFIISLLGFIIYGIMIEGGSTFAIFVVLATAVVTGLVGRLHSSELAETFIDGAKPLTWLFVQFVLFSPFLKFIQDMGTFEAVKNVLMPFIETGGRGLLVFMASGHRHSRCTGSRRGPKGSPARDAQRYGRDTRSTHECVGIGIAGGLTNHVLLLSHRRHPGSMGLVRSHDLNNMIIFGVVATIPVLLYAAIRVFLLSV